jgi:hypothetical protein
MSKFGNVFVKSSNFTNSQLVPSINAVKLKANMITGESMVLNQGIDVANATIRDDVQIEGETEVNKRIYQELNSDASWNSVNGYYGLAKDAYPAVSEAYAEKAVSEWSNNSGLGTNRLPTGVVWSSKLKLFLLISDNTNRVGISYNGINWSNITILSRPRVGCWSDELNLFVIISRTSSNVYLSNDGINWETISNPEISFGEWRYIVWSKELNLLVAVSQLYKIMVSNDGYQWNLVELPEPDASITLNSICWSPELSMFVVSATSSSINK